MADRLAIANVALGLLGANRIQSFEDGTVEADLCRDLYESVVREALEDHPWNFAEACVRLARDTSPARPDFDFSYQLPTDCVRPLHLLDEDGREARGYRYRIVKPRKLCTDLERPFLVYLYRAPEADWTGKFALAVAYNLAHYLAGPITEDQQKVRDHKQLYADQLGSARNRSSQEDTPEQIETGALVDFHHG